MNPGLVLDAAGLWETHDLTSVGTLANAARERVSDAKAYYRRTVEVAPADWQSAAEGLDGRWEIRLGGLEALGLDELCRLASVVPSSGPRLRMLTWRELAQVAEREQRGPDDVLGALSASGLRLLAGGPILDEDSIRWRPSLEAAQRAAMRADLVWIVRQGEAAERVAADLQALQSAAAEYGLFDCVIPRVVPAVEIDPPTGYNRLRAIALARLVLTAIPHVRGSAADLGESLMQVAQWYGADDAGGAGTVSECDRLATLLRETGREPVEAR